MVKSYLTGTLVRSRLTSMYCSRVFLHSSYVRQKSLRQPLNFQFDFWNYWKGLGHQMIPGSGIGFFRIPDPKAIFLELSDNFLGKKFYNSLKIGPNFFLQHFNTKIIVNFVKFVATWKGMTKNFFHPSLLLLFWDPGWEKIRIRDKHPGSATLTLSWSYLACYIFEVWETI